MFVQFRASDWPLTNERHFAPNDVEKLRDLIQRVSPAPRGKRTGDAAVTFCFHDRVDLREIFDGYEGSDAIARRPHGAELQKPQIFSFPADAAMTHQRRLAGKRKNYDS